MTRTPYQEQPDSDAMRAWRHHLHAHPELGFDVENTAAYVAERLERWGFEVTRGLGRTGVVGRLTVGDAALGPMIALRADMDALPIHEATGLPYASTRPGKMHACGHDGHTAMLLGGADLIARRVRSGEIKGNGTLIVIFQPAEELGGSASGARMMMKDGLAQRFPYSEVYGLHVGPNDPVGVMQFCEGAFMCSSDTVEVTFHGRSAHAAAPHMSRDASLAMSAAVLALHTIIGRNLDPYSTGMLSVGKMQAGTVFNVVPDTAHLTLSVRGLTGAVAQTLHQRIGEVVHAQAQAYGCTATIETDYGLPVLVNDAAETAHGLATARRLFGEAGVNPDYPPIAASEDFPFLAEGRRSAYFIIGNGENGYRDGQPIGPCVVHNPHFDFNDALLPIGAAFWAGLVEDRFLPGTGQEDGQASAA